MPNPETVIDATDRINERRNPVRRYDSVDLSVASLNDQIVECELQKEAFDDEIEKAEQRVRDAVKLRGKVVKQADKLRAKRDHVQLAAYNISRLDQP